MPEPSAPSPAPGSAPSSEVLFLYEVVGEHSESEGPSSAEAELAARLFADVLHRTALAEGMELMTRADLATLIEADSQLRALRDCSDDDCFISLTASSRVRFFLSATLSTDAGTQRLSVRVFDRTTRTVVHRDTAALPPDNEGAEKALATLAAGVVGRVRAVLAEERARATPRWIDGFSRLGIAGLAGAGVGVVTLIVGSGIAIHAASTASRVEVRDDGTYGPQTLAADAHQLGWAANALWIAGGILAAGGATLAFLQWEAPAVQVSVQPGGAAVRLGGTF